MQTISIGIQNNCAACGCACKYCLLQSDKKASGIDYYRGKRLAERFAQWKKTSETQLPIYYCIGYCAEYPELFDNIRFNKTLGFVGGDFLQCNGIKIRNEAETKELIKRIKAAGIAMIDTTFFGTKEYHDQFAARQGDFEFLLRLSKCAVSEGIVCAPTFVICEENKGMLSDLFDILTEITGLKMYSFLQDYRGRGYLLENSRLRIESYEKLPEKIKNTFNKVRYKTESEWLNEGKFSEYTERAIIINLRQDNIELFENMTCEEIIYYVENLDDEYYNTIPKINELAKMYGDFNNNRLYQSRDLFWKWQKRYIAENNIKIYDVTDERFCSSVRR
jgi:hypothetical protein